MRLVYLLICIFFGWTGTKAQNYYFPPVNNDNWETVDPASLGWCTDKIPALYNYLQEQDSKAFIVLKDGKIVLEKYFGTFTKDSMWYWASAGKTLTSFLVGLAQEQNKLDISDKTSEYLGTGWTSLPPAKEDLITVRNQLTMTSGLDDGTGDGFCTNPECLRYKADAGTRWAYHNGPYTLLDKVITNATGQNLNVFGNQQLFTKTGMSGLFVKVDFNNVFFSKPRSMARFGSLVLNQGNWGNLEVMKDKTYWNEMVNTSQDINLSYGYLWWLNGKDKAMLPGSQIVYNRSLFVNAPADMYSALGKNGQFLNVVPSQNLVMIRMGNYTGDLPVPFLLNDEIWARFNQIQCSTSTTDEVTTKMTVTPNPAYGEVVISSSKEIQKISLIQANGVVVKEIKLPVSVLIQKVDVSQLAAGIYLFSVHFTDGTSTTSRFVKAGN
ncbi:MAG: serine hydrolase [Saprospiraceae bacterium]|nr:serine hydrolase [Saprospiraceae bacterium]